MRWVAKRVVSGWQAMRHLPCICLCRKTPLRPDILLLPWINDSFSGLADFAGRSFLKNAFLSLTDGKKDDKIRLAMVPARPWPYGPLAQLVRASGS